MGNDQSGPGKKQNGEGEGGIGEGGALGPSAAQSAPGYGALARKAIVEKPELQRFDSADFFSGANGGQSSAAPPAPADSARPAVDYAQLNQRAGRQALLRKSGAATRPKRFDSAEFALRQHRTAMAPPPPPPKVPLNESSAKRVASAAGAQYGSLNEKAGRRALLSHKLATRPRRFDSKLRQTRFARRGTTRFLTPKCRAGADFALRQSAAAGATTSPSMTSSASAAMVTPHSLHDVPEPQAQVPPAVPLPRRQTRQVPQVPPEVMRAPSLPEGRQRFDSADHFSGRGKTQLGEATGRQVLLRRALMGKPELKRFDSTEHAVGSKGGGGSASSYGALNQKAGRAALLNRKLGGGGGTRTRRFDSADFALRQNATDPKVDARRS